MPTLRSVRMKQQILLRIIADILILNGAVLTALTLRFLYLVVFEPAPVDISYNALFWAYLLKYLQTSWLLTAISLSVFAVSGFYTYGRAYKGPYKAVIVAQAVSLAYLLYGFISYFLDGALDMPRGAWVVAWIVSAVALVASRVWAWLWSNVVRAEISLEQPEKREVRKVLVIGGAGYIGSALLPKLLANGYHVRLLDLLIYGTEPIQEVLGHPNLEIMQADFRQVDKVVEAMRSIDAVIHLGAIVGDPACALDEELTIEVNLMATRMIAEVAKGSGVNRFIFASTCSVYGANDETLDERSALNPVSIYARSKIASEKVLMSMASSDFSPTLLRFGTIYGLSGRTRFDLVINLLTAKAVIEGQITVFGGDQWRPFVHVDDAALAVLTAMEAPLSLVSNQVFNVGCDEQNFTIQQAGEIIQRMVPTSSLISMGSDTDRRNYKVSFGKIHKTLGFTPQWTVAQGIRQVIEAIESGKVQNYHEAKYSNVKFLSDEGTSRLIRRQNGWAHDLIKESSSEIAIAAGE